MSLSLVDRFIDASSTADQLILRQNINTLELPQLCQHLNGIRYRVLNLSNNKFKDTAFEQLLRTINETRAIKELHFKVANFTTIQIDRLISLTSTRKGLKLVDLDGSTIGPLYANWTRYVIDKEKSKEYPLKDITSSALKLYKDIYGGLPALVLDFGSGTGCDTIPLANLGVKEILAVDADDGAMKSLVANLPKPSKSTVRCINSPFIELKVARSVDMLISSFTWPYRPPQNFPACWKKCVSVVKPGGIILGQFFGPPKTRDRNMTYHTKDEVIKLLSRNFEIVWMETEPEGTKFKLSGGDTPAWGDLHHIIARKKITCCDRLKMRISHILTIFRNYLISLLHSTPDRRIVT